MSECKAKAKIVDLCEKGDAFIKEYELCLFRCILKRFFISELCGTYVMSI